MVWIETRKKMLLRDVEIRVTADWLIWNTLPSSFHDVVVVFGGFVCCHFFLCHVLNFSLRNRSLRNCFHSQDKTRLIKCEMYIMYFNFNVPKPNKVL